MLKIGEFSKLTQVSIRMLRRYDEVGLLKPDYIDNTTGYRFYNASQIDKLHKIIALRDAGFLIAEMMDILQQDDVDMKKVLNEKFHEIQKDIQLEKEKLCKIKQMQYELSHPLQSMKIDFQIKHVASVPVLSLRRIIPDYYHEGQLWHDLSKFAERQNISFSNDTFSIYHDLEFKEQDVDVEICSQVNAFGKDEGEFKFYHSESVELMASAMVYGPFTNIKNAYIAFASWLEQHDQYEMLATSRQIVHRGPWNEKEEVNYVTEMQIPIRYK